MQIRNPFKQPLLAKQFDAMIRVYETKHRDLIRADGGRCMGNAWATNFWRGYDGCKLMRWDAAAKQTPAYACYRAGQVIKASESLKAA